VSRFGRHQPVRVWVDAHATQLPLDARITHVFDLVVRAAWQLCCDL